MKKELLLVPLLLNIAVPGYSETEEKGAIQLNFNENQYGCFPSVKDAMIHALEYSAFYPDDARDQFIQELALYHSVDKEQILVSNGLSSILVMIANAFIKKGTKVISADPTYPFFLNTVQSRGGQVVKVPLLADYSFDLDAMLAEVDDNTKVVLICNPNNPTGTITPREKIEAFIEKLPSHVFVIIDEAYHHFAEGSEGYVSFLEKPVNYPNVIVGRTFSKVYGLAGMRVGYVVSSKETIELLSEYFDPDNNNVAALFGASMALQDTVELEKILQHYSQVKEEFYRQLETRGLFYIRSYGNFVMFETAGYDVEEIREYFKKNGMLLGRKYAIMPNFVRVSLGQASQMQKFWEIWDRYVASRS